MPRDIGAIARETRWLYRLARSLVHDDAAADDLVQETLLRAVKSPPDTGAPLRGWLATVARNVFFADRRAKNRRTAREVRSARSEIDDRPSDLLERTDAQRRLLEAVTALEPTAQRIILMRFFDDVPIEEIARLTQISTETVRTRLRRSLADLRRKLEAEYGTGNSWRTALWPLAASAALAGGKSIAAKKSAAAQIVAGVFLMSQSAKWILALTILFAAIGSVALLFPPKRIKRDAPLDVQFVRPESSPVGQTDEASIPTDGDFVGRDAARAPGSSSSDDSANRPQPKSDPNRPATETPSKGRIEGIVRGVDGLPVAGAVVYCRFGPGLVVPWNDPWTPIIQTRFGEISDLPESLRAETDTIGGFRFEGLSLGTPHVVFAIDKVRGVGLSKSLTLHRISPEAKIVVTLLAGSNINVAVRESSGSPIARAHVSMTVNYGEISPVVAMRTGSDGKIRTTAVPLFDLEIAVAKEGYASPPPRRFENVVPGHEITAEFVLDKGKTTRLSGRLVSKSMSAAKLLDIYGDPRMRDRIKVIVYESDPGSVPRSRDGVEAGIDFEKGVWWIDYDEKKRPTIVVFFDERPIGRGSVADPSRPSDITFDQGFHPLPVESGSVEISVAARGGSSMIVEWADVLLIGAEPHNLSIEHKARIVDFAGVVTFRKVLYGRYLAVVRSPGFATKATLVDHGNTGIERFGHRTRSRIELEKATSVIRGKLRRADGGVVANAPLTLLNAAGLPIMGARSPIDRSIKTTDSDGEFEWRDLEVGRYEVLVEPEPGSLFVTMALAGLPEGPADDFVVPKLSRVGFRPSFSGRDAYLRIESPAGIVLLDDLLRGERRSDEFSLSIPSGLWNIQVRTIGEDPWTGSFRNESDDPAVVPYGSKNW